MASNAQSILLAAAIGGTVGAIWGILIPHGIPRDNSCCIEDDFSSKNVTIMILQMLA